MVFLAELDLFTFQQGACQLLKVADFSAQSTQSTNDM